MRPVLFWGDAERVHDWTLRRLARASPRTLALLRRRYAVRNPVTVFGLDFPNRVGLAAGMDKDGVALPAWPALGFGFVEVGTVTWRPQRGNDRPRLFRRPAEEAIVNRMGFNNAGAGALAARIAAVGIPLGVSLGKSRDTPLEAAVGDYVASFGAVKDRADYVAVNVSSPNTLGLRTLQNRAHLDELLAALGRDKPVLVKIAPDLTEHAIGEVLQVCADRGAAGVIATNTLPVEGGGLSGRPLTARSREVVAFVAKRSELPVIGVGGIMTVDDAARMFDAGASLVQLYTGFVYHGPRLVRQVASL